MANKSGNFSLFTGTGSRSNRFLFPAMIILLSLPAGACGGGGQDDATEVAEVTEGNTEEDMEMQDDGSTPDQEMEEVTGEDMEEEEKTPVEGDWAAVSAGSSHTCALARDGSLWCWGNSWDGQLGNPDAWAQIPVEIDKP
jgi:hypothetical protein